MSSSVYSSSAAGGRASRQLQWPFIGIVVLLVVLILLTPNLFSPTAGGLQTQAQLVVDRAGATGPTSLYIESIGSATRYQSISVGLASLPAWPYRGPTNSLGGWNWTNVTETLVLDVQSTSNPVVVNITVKYTDPSGFTVEYAGLFGIFVDAGPQDIEVMQLPANPVVAPTTTPIHDLPIFFVLSLRMTAGNS